MKTEHIWTIENWKKIPELCRDDRRVGLRLRMDKDVDPEVRRACKDFAKWVRQEYYFPVRIPVYVKSAVRIKAKDGDRVCGTFFRPDNYRVEPYARIATGDYPDLCKKWGKDSALTSILFTLAHELTHYFQWINNLPLTSSGEERQATRYSQYILEEYASTRDHP